MLYETPNLGTGRAPTLTDVVGAMDDFVTSRGWYTEGSKRPQTPRNLAASLSIEAAELLECFQWSEDAEISKVEDELADVILYACQLAGVLKVDLQAAVLGKLVRNYRRTWDVSGEGGVTEK